MASIAHHVGSLVWVPEKGVDGTLFRSKKVARWVRGRVAALRPGADGQPGLEVVTEEGATHVLAPADAPLQNERDDTVDDLVKSDFLHEPGCARGRPPRACPPRSAARRRVPTGRCLVAAERERRGSGERPPCTSARWPALWRPRTAGRCGGGAFWPRARGQRAAGWLEPARGSGSAQGGAEPGAGG